MQNYEVLKELGSGAFGRVIQVKDKKNNGPLLALKMVKMTGLSEKQRLGALNQIRLLAAITSPNVISYHDAFLDHKTSSLCIVMQYADGGDLQVAFDILCALKTLHENSILHRDLKPANVFFVDGVAKLGDLNISKATQGGFACTQAGTPYYTAPQIWKGQIYDMKCDIWSLGCLLYQCAALNPPFNAQDIPSLSKKVNSGVFQPIPNTYSKRLSEIISSCLHPNYRERPSAAMLLQDSVFTFMQKTSQGSVNLVSSIKCPKILQLFEQKLPEVKNMIPISNIVQKPLTERRMVSQQKNFKPYYQKVNYNNNPNVQIYTPQYDKQNVNRAVSPQYYRTPNYQQQLYSNNYRRMY